MRQGFDYWFGLPYSHDMRMTVAARDNGYQSARVLRPEAGVLGRAADAERRRHRAAGRPSHADQAIHRRSRALSSTTNSSAAVLPLPRALAAAHPARPIGRLRRAQRAAASTATSSRRSTASTGRVLDALKRGRSRSDGRWSCFTSDNGPWLPFGDARRLRRSAARRQGDDVGRRRAHAGDFLVARHGPPVGRDGHRLSDGSVRDGGEARPAPSRRPIASSTASISVRPPPHRIRPRARHRAAVLLYSDNELRAAAKGRHTSAHLHHQRPWHTRTAKRADHDPPLSSTLADDPGASTTTSPASYIRHRGRPRQSGRGASDHQQSPPSRCSMNCWK